MVGDKEDKKGADEEDGSDGLVPATSSSSRNSFCSSHNGSVWHYPDPTRSKSRKAIVRLGESRASPLPCITQQEPKNPLLMQNGWNVDI